MIHDVSPIRHSSRKEDTSVSKAAVVRKIACNGTKNPKVISTSSTSDSLSFASREVAVNFPSQPEAQRPVADNYGLIGRGLFGSLL